METELIGGRYRLDGELGAGGMGTVWRAFDELLARPVAVKEIRFPPHTSAQERAGLTARAMTEARAAAALTHPAIVAVHDVTMHDGKPWIVMQLVPGRSLQQLVNEDGPLSVEEVTQLGLRLLGALETAHAGGVTHRDVKPSNVLVPGGGATAMLTDFSIAKVMGYGTTNTGVPMGSAGYIAPERMLTGVTGYEGDLFCLGATLFFALEGQGPFYRADAMVAILAAAVDPHPRPRRAGHLTAVLDALLIKDPRERATLDQARAMLLHPPVADPTAFAPSAPAPSAPTPFTPPPPTPLTPPPAASSPLTPPPLTPAPITPLDPSPATPSPLTPPPVTPSALTPPPVSPAPLTPPPVTPSALTPPPAGPSPLTPPAVASSALTPPAPVADPLMPPPLAAPASGQLQPSPHAAAPSPSGAYAPADPAQGQAPPHASTPPPGAYTPAPPAAQSGAYAPADPAQGQPTPQAAAAGPAGSTAMALGASAVSGVRQGDQAVPPVLGGREGDTVDDPPTAQLAQPKTGQGKAGFSRGRASVPLSEKARQGTGDAPSAEHEPPREERKSRRGLLVTGAAVIAAAAMGGTAWALRDRKTPAQRTGDTASPTPSAASNLEVLSGHRDEIWAVAWASDSKRLASASADFTVRLWTTTSATSTRVLTGHGGEVYTVEWSPDGSRLATGAADNTARIWSAQTGTEEKVLQHEQAVRSVTWSPDGRLLATGSNDRKIRIWEAASGQLLRTLVGHTSAALVVAWAPNGSALASVGDLGDQAGFLLGSVIAARVWDPATGAQILTVSTGKKQAPASRSGLGPAIVLAGHAASPATTSLAWSPDSTLLATGNDASTTWLWDAKTGEQLRVLGGHTDVVNAVAFKPDKALIATASADQTVLLWNPGSSTVLRTFTGHTGSVNALAFSPDGKWLVSASSDKSLRMWEAVA